MKSINVFSILKFIFSIWILFLTNLYVFSQKTKGNSTVNTIPLNSNSHEENEYSKLKSKLKEMDGTFQFIIKKEEYKPLIKMETLERIESSRLKDQPTEIFFDEYISIYIPSKNEIENSSFQKLNQYKFIK